MSSFHMMTNPTIFSHCRRSDTRIPGVVSFYFHRRPQSCISCNWSRLSLIFWYYFIIPQIWLFTWANIYCYSPGRIYIVIRPGEYILLFARANIYGYSPGRITFYIRTGECILLFARANIYCHSPTKIFQCGSITVELHMIV